MLFLVDFCIVIFLMIVNFVESFCEDEIVDGVE